jgi:hypothetical protein
MKLSISTTVRGNGDAKNVALAFDVAPVRLWVGGQRVGGWYHGKGEEHLPFSVTTNSASSPWQYQLKSGN